MAMSIGANQEGPMTQINTTPLIDVMLVLLIMMIITLPAMTHAIKLDRPTSGVGEAPESVELIVDFDGKIVWGGVIVASMGELEQKMRASSRTKPQPMINVRADRRAKYDTVAHVLGMAQRNGLQRIAIEGTP
jgi:biopolymer transport protein ExbD